jgi:hypothetical protein
MVAYSELEAAQVRAAELLTLWQWRKAFAYRMRLAQIKFETVGLDPAEQKRLAADIANFGDAVSALADDTSWRAAA